MNGDDSERIDHVLAHIEHKFEKPSAEEHFGACVGDVRSILNELRHSS